MGRSGSFQAPPGFRDSATRALNPGEVVTSTYAVRAEVARTDTGIVYEARDMMLDRPVALKLAWRDPGMPSLILEARRCAAVRDPCAVAIYGMGNHQGIEYVAGERVAGRLLAEVLQQPLPAPELLAKHRRLVGAVTRAHEAGIAVGELSGATVLVDDDGRMVLGRLSLSQVPAFGPRGRILAPEVVRGEVQASDPSAAEAIDLYGLGCVAIEMARGLPPFVDADPAIELRGHALEAPPRLGQVRPDLPGELSDLVEWLLEKRPVARPRSARDVLAQLEVIIDRLGTTSRALAVEPGAPGVRGGAGRARERGDGRGAQAQPRPAGSGVRVGGAEGCDECLRAVHVRARDRGGAPAAAGADRRNGGARSRAVRGGGGAVPRG